MDIIEDAQRIMRSYGDIPAVEIARKLLREKGVMDKTPEEMNDYQMWLERWVKNHRAITEKEEKAFHLWYLLLYANEYGYIDTNDWDDPTDAPDYISVIVRFLEAMERAEREK